MKITGETLIKGLFYFMLKAKMGGKYRSKKLVAGKGGKQKWVYDYGKKHTANKKVNPADIQKYKDKKMNDFQDYEENIMLVDEPLTQEEKRANRKYDYEQLKAAKLPPEKEIELLQKMIDSENEESTATDDDLGEYQENIILVDDDFDDIARDRIQKLQKKIQSKKGKK